MRATQRRGTVLVQIKQKRVFGTGLLKYDIYRIEHLPGPPRAGSPGAPGHTGDVVLEGARRARVPRLSTAISR